MNDSDRLTRYVRTARTGGTEVELVKEEDLAGRLGSLLEALCNEFSGRGEVPLEPAGQTAFPATLLAAVPASGWPEQLFPKVAAILQSAGFAVTTQEDRSGTYTWDRDVLKRACVGLTFCPAFLADTGSIVMPSGPGMGTLASLLPEVHIALSHAEGCRANLAEYLTKPGFLLPSRLILITGPSRTGDIEGTMTPGVHGPRRVLHLVLHDGAITS